MCTSLCCYCCWVWVIHLKNRIIMSQTNADVCVLSGLSHWEFTSQFDSPDKKWIFFKASYIISHSDALSSLYCKRHFQMFQIQSVWCDFVLCIVTCFQSMWSTFCLNGCSCKSVFGVGIWHQHSGCGSSRSVAIAFIASRNIFVRTDATGLFHR